MRNVDSRVGDSVSGEGLERSGVLLPLSVGHNGGGDVRGDTKTVQQRVEVGENSADSGILLETLLGAGQAGLLREPGLVVADDDGLVRLEQGFGQSSLASRRVGHSLTDGLDNGLGLRDNEGVEGIRTMATLDGLEQILVLLEKAVGATSKKGLRRVGDRDSVVALDELGEETDAKGHNVTLGNDDTLEVILGDLLITTSFRKKSHTSMRAR